MAETKYLNRRVVFMGTPDFAVESLKALYESGYNIVGVITAADKPAGRGYQLKESAVKTYAKSVGLNILQPKNLKAPEFIEELRSLKADLQVVVAFRMLPEVVWNMPLLGTINLHGSLLPQYRGAAPINWAVINGDKETGVTTFFIRQEIDTGAIIDQAKVEIEQRDNAGVVHDKLMTIGAELVVKTVGEIFEDKVKPIEQDELIKDTLRPAPKIHRDTCQINWDQPAETVYNFIRGLSPYPAAWTKVKLKGKDKHFNFKIFDSTIEEDSEIRTVAPGSMETDDKTYLRIACRDAWLTILMAQLEGKKRMNIDDLLRGTDISEIITD